MHRSHLISLLNSCLLLLLTVSPAGAATFGERLQSVFGGGDTAATEYLDADEAFALSALAVSRSKVDVRWQIAPGYYLYRDKMSFAVAGSGHVIDQAALVLPTGRAKTDEYFGDTEIYTNEVIVSVPLIATAAAVSQLSLQVGYQGCKDKSICYPPIKKLLTLTLPAAAGAFAGRAPTTTTAAAAVLSPQDSISQRLRQQGLLVNILAFLGFGLLLSLTPCIFPMVPILSGIIVGQDGQITPLKGFALSLAYVVAMAATYAVLGVIAGALHFNLQAASQNIWVISAFSLVFVGLALSMFGLYELQVPSALQSRLARSSSAQSSGTVRGAAIMGAVSAIIVGPCVAPPLAGALLYISQTGNALLGGAALFAMGLGLGAPLLLLGISAGKLLPRAGHWMQSVKHVFGVIMLAVAVWFMERVLPGPVALALWAILLVVSAVFMGALDRLDQGATWPRLWKGLGILLLIYGIVVFVGAVTGGERLLQPLHRLTQLHTTPETASPQLSFLPVHNATQLDQALAGASTAGRRVMLDFYADWCVTCKEMEQRTFTDPQVHSLLQNFVLLQADVTDNDEQARELLERFDLFGPPAILFFDPVARELRAMRVIGFVKAADFAQHLRTILRT